MLIDAIVQSAEDGTPRGIAAGIAGLIRTGEIPPGSRMPTVRDIAKYLAVSPATVSHAWQALVGAGLIQTRGRAGTFVLSRDAGGLPPRSHGLAGHAPSRQAVRIDLASGVPDPQLLPNITESLNRVVAPRAATSSYLQPPLLAELEDPLHALWPYRAPALTIVNGAMDGVQRTLDLTTRFGDRVVIETPTFPLLLDLLAQMNLHPVTVPLDDEGMVPEYFRTALDAKPAAIVLQPRAHNPTGISMSRARAELLADILAHHPKAHDTVVIEDDHSGGIAVARNVSFGSWLPRRTVHVHSFSKSHGPDLRIAALSAPAGAIEQIESRRVLGPGWTSRMLQTILLHLLTARQPITAVEDARRVYHMRQTVLARELGRAGIPLTRADGLNLWLPVHDEQDAQIQLAAHGIRVALGSPFLPTDDDGRLMRVAGPHRGDHIRVSIGMLRDGIAEVADSLATVARP